MRTLLLLMLCMTYLNVLAQDEKLTSSVYVEGLGAGVFYSCNIEFLHKEHVNHALAFRIGFSNLPFDFFTEPATIRSTTVPMQVNLLLGNKQIAFEVGGGFTPVFRYSDEPPSSFDDFVNAPVSGSGITLIGTLNLGLRIQTSTDQFIRLNWTPILYNDDINKFWGGISFGSYLN